jgi:apolipoprotein N-acyltransferase
MPLLVALMSPSRAIMLGLVTGAVYFTGTLYWVTRVMVRYGDLQPWVAVLINMAMIATEALHLALFAVIVRRLLILYGRGAILAAPMVWVTTELTRTHVMYVGFPWVLLGNSQSGVLPIAQLASIFGVYGVSMLVAAVSAGLAFSVGPGRNRFAPIAVVLSIVIGVWVWGSRRVARGELTQTGDAIRVGLVQGNVDQGAKWDAGRAAAIFENHLRLTEQALNRRAAFVIWPESSTPFMLEENPIEAERIRALARRAQVPILLGSDQIEWRVASDNRRVPGRIFNSAFLVAPDGTTGGVYRKMHLVPFGEYVPMKKLLFFAAPLVEAVSDFSAGDSFVLLPVAGHQVSTAICYEIIYPELVRRFVAEGSELLTTITNDAWFGDTSAPYQHFTQASMRAIEEGRYLVRSANTGISGIVDPYGRVIERSAVFQQTVIVGTVRFLKASTFYARHGDVLAYAAAAFTLVAVLPPRRRVQ